MMKDKDKWVENLRSQMEDYSEPLPHGMWERLEQELKPVRVVPMWRTYRFAAAAAIAVLVVTSLTVWFVNSPSADYLRQNHSVANVLPTVPFQEKMEGEEMILADVSQDRNHSGAKAEEKRRAVEKNLLSIQAEKPFRNAASEMKGTQPIVEKQVDHSEETVKDSQTKRRFRLETDRRRMVENSRAVRNEKKQNHKWSVGVGTGNTPYGISDSFDGMARLSTSRSTLQTVSDMMVPVEEGSQTTYNQILLNNRDLNPRTEYHHKMPVTVGATVKWNFSDKWALETGLAYTLLVSELNTGSPKYRTEDEQKLHYVGIPLKVHRLIWNSRWLSLYASVGGMMEKCVSASLNTVYQNGLTVRKTESHLLEVKPLQWSVSAAMGAQVNFTPQLGLYVEPGAAYYFDDGTEVETIRKEHPFNFNLQLGLRFSFSK